MTSRLRIARLDSAPYTPADPAGVPTAEAHGRIDALVRAHLPAVTASLFARPQPSPDGGAVEWYSDLAGQPTPLGALPAAERARVTALLGDRLASLAELADRLAHGDAAAAKHAAALRTALAYPGDEAIYVVAGQPVLVFWGHRRKGAEAAAPGSAVPPTPPATGTDPGAVADADAGASPPTPPIAVATAAPPSPPRRRVGPWLWAVLLLLLFAVALGVAYRVLGWGLRWPPWGPDYAALLSAARADGEAQRAQLVELEAVLGGRLEVCAVQRALAAARAEGARLDGTAEALERELADALALCPLRQGLDAARSAAAALGAEVGALEERLAKAVRACRRTAQAQRRATETASAPRTAGPTPSPAGVGETPAAAEAARQPTLPPCPGERPPEQAPDVAIVLDASGSMRLPATLQAARIQDELRKLGAVWELLGSIVLQQSGGPSRLDEAKRGVNSVVRSLPDDVDVGLTVLQDCPRADNLGFFPGARRGELYGRVDRLRPMQGTPLANGVENAGAMLGGVNTPAVIVVISDGEDSCGGDPCAAARALKRRKPQLTINVVDIIGNGAGACMAQATGGKMLRPADGLAFEKTIREAAEDVLKPTHCP